MWRGNGLLGLLWSFSVSRGQQPPGSRRSELLGLQLCQHYCVSPAALWRSPPGHWAAGTGSSGVWVGVHTHELNPGCPHMGLLPSGLSWNQQLDESWAKSAMGPVVWDHVFCAYWNTSVSPQSALLLFSFLVSCPFPSLALFPYYPLGKSHWLLPPHCAIAWTKGTRGPFHWLAKVHVVY